MQNPSVSIGAIAFVGPPHISALEGFTYVTVTKVQGTTATVQITGPDDPEESNEFEVKCATIRHRIVGADERELWPGSYVGHPIAFVQPAGITCGQWAYGLVSGYSMQNGAAVLTVRSGTEILRLPLTSPQSVIAVDRLNYALCTGATVNATGMNAFELLDRQNEVIVACGKSRSGIPASVLSTMLSVAFEPEEQVPLIRPDTLAVVLVRRQHIVDCEMDSRSNNHNGVFVDRLLPAPPTSAPEPLPTDLPLSNCMDMAFSDSDDEGKTEDPTEQANISLVRLQNRRLRKRTRDSDEDGSGLLPADDIDNPTLSLSSDAQASSFRPSQMERYVHNAVAHPSLRGKNAQAILESVQQGRQTQFLATPPVLRLAYDFSFHVRGLSLMHFRRFMEELEQQPTMSGVNMTNFGRVNSLHPATPPRTVSDIVEAFNTLLLFADRFYSPLVYSFIKAGATFMEKYAVLSRPDPATCNMLVFWVNSKLGKFRSEVIATNVQTAALIGNEFARNDDHLMELFQAQQERQVTALVASRTSRAAPGSRPSHSRDQRTQKPSAVPRELSSMLPNQGNKTLCMRYISKKGCTGPAPGLCFDPNRAHFRPIALPADAKAFIDKNFFGLGQEYQDL